MIGSIAVRELASWMTATWQSLNPVDPRNPVAPLAPIPVAPVVPATLGFMNEDAFSAIKDGAQLINLARGELVEEAAVISALDSGKLARYIADFPSEKLIAHEKAVLFPQQSGVLTIDPMELECIARIRVKSQRMVDPFGMFSDPFFSDAFGGVQDVKYNAKSQPIKINVRELPGTAPSTFSGAVGSLMFEASLDKAITKENEPVNLKFSNSTIISNISFLYNIP